MPYFFSSLFQSICHWALLKTSTGLNRCVFTAHSSSHVSPRTGNWGCLISSFYLLSSKLLSHTQLTSIWLPASQAFSNNIHICHKHLDFLWWNVLECFQIFFLLTPEIFFPCCRYQLSSCLWQKTPSTIFSWSPASCIFLTHMLSIVRAALVFSYDWKKLLQTSGDLNSL